MTSLKQAVVGDVEPVLWTLFGGMLIVLTIACANVATLFRVRARTRRHETAVRRALGASNGQIVRLFFVESLALTVLAAAAGIALATVLVSVVVASSPTALPRAAEVSLGGLAMALAFGSAVIMAVWYAALGLRGPRASVTSALSESTPCVTSGGRRGLLRDPGLALQVALATVLMVGSALMVQTYRNLSNRELGFDPSAVLAFDVNLASRRAADHVRIYGAMIDAVARVPGVVAASAASFAPLTGSEDMFATEAGRAPIPFKFVLPGYFDVMRTPILEGQRPTSTGDTPLPSPVYVSAALARQLYPGESAVGQFVRRLEEDGSVPEMFVPETGTARPVPPFTVAGVVGDVREVSLRDAPAEIVYVPILDPPVESQIVPTNMTVFARTSVPPLTVAPAIRDAIASTDPDLTPGAARPLDDIVHAARAREAFVGALLLAAAAVSLLLSTVGIYGVVAYGLRQRAREVGIRLALGASRPRAVTQLASSVLWAVVCGISVGVVAALVASRTLATLLFQVGGTDPVTYLAVVATLAIAALLAILLAGRNVVRVSPTIAFRGE